MTTVSHRDFLRTLSTEEKRKLTSKSNTHGLLRLLSLTVLLLTLSFFIAHGSSAGAFYWPLLMLPQGILLISMFHLLHECVHDTPFQTRRINTVVGQICGLLLLLPSGWFTYFHRDHHRYTQVQGKDPELATAKPSSRTQWIVHVTGIPVFKSLIHVIARCSLGKFDSYVPAKAQASVTREARMMVLVYVILLLINVLIGSTLLLWIWVVPLILGQPFLRLYLLAEHTLCENTENMFLNTRTVLTHPLVRWFTWNMPYHTEHHVYPGVPFHKLPQLHNKMQTYLQHTSTGYSEFTHHHFRTLR